MTLQVDHRTRPESVDLGKAGWADQSQHRYRWCQAELDERSIDLVAEPGLARAFTGVKARELMDFAGKRHGE